MRTISTLAVVTLLATAGSGEAQELEPRVYLASPVGGNLVVLGVALSFGDVIVDSTAPVDDARARVGSLIADFCACGPNVQCRLQIIQDGNVRVVRIAGRLTSADVADLLIACSEVIGPVRVDLSDVLAADPIAIDALRRVRDAGAELAGVPRYMQFKLDSFPTTDGS